MWRAPRRPLSGSRLGVRSAWATRGAARSTRTRLDARRWRRAREPREGPLRSPDVADERVQMSPVALTAAGGPWKTYPRAKRRSAQRTSPPTPCHSAGEADATSARIIGPSQAASLGSATATPPRARVGTAGAAIVLAAAPHRGGSRRPWDTRSDAACHVIGACAIDASLFGAASCGSRWRGCRGGVASTSPRTPVAG
jgi:hypothetical protein